MKNIVKVIIGILILAVVASASYFIWEKFKLESLRSKKIKQGENKYFILSKDNTSGVIDEKGNVLLDPIFTKIVIPNYSYPLFFAYNVNNDVLIFKGNEITEFKNIDVYSIQGISENNSGYRNMLKYKEKNSNKFGFIDLDGRKITNTIYDEISALNEDESKFLVTINGKKGLVNEYGIQIVAPKYDDILSANIQLWNSKKSKNGYITKKVNKNGIQEFGFISNDGKEILKSEYENVIKSEIDGDNYYLVVQKNGKKGVFKNNKKIIDTIFDEIIYSDYNFIVQKYNKYGMYDLNGKEIFKTRFNNYKILGKYISFNEDDKNYIFDEKGNKVTEGKYNVIGSVQEKDYLIIENKNGEKEIISKDKTVQNGYLDIYYAFDNKFVFNKNGKYGVLDFYEGEKIPAIYDYISLILNANMMEAVKDNVTKIINRDLEEIKIDGTYTKEFIENKGLVVYNEKTRIYLNKDGKEINPKEIQESKMYPIFVNGKWGFADENKNIVIEAKYEKVSDFNKYGFASFKENGKWGVIDINKNIIVEPKIVLERTIDPKFIKEFLIDENKYHIVLDTTSMIK